MLVNPEVRPCLRLPESVHVVAASQKEIKKDWRGSEITKVRYTAQSPSLSLAGVFYVGVIRPRGASGCRPTNNPFLFFSFLHSRFSGFRAVCFHHIAARGGHLNGVFFALNHTVYREVRFQEPFPLQSRD